MASYDIIIKNGTVFDGKGNVPQKTDIGITKDEIKKIGDLQKESATEVIDAKEKYVSPGFIDLTNHSDTHWTLFTQPKQESLLRQGVTTVLGGNCGSSLAPLLKGGSKSSFARWADISQININWQTVGELLKELENHQLGVNFATLVGFNTLTRESSNLNQMKVLLGSSIKEGAFGLSTNLGMIYGPSLDEELEELFKLLRKRDCFTKHHLKDEGKNTLPAIAHLIGLARRTNVNLHISHFKVLGKSAWEFFDNALEMMRNARLEKVKLTGDFFPYERTGSNLFILMPSWLRTMKEEEIKETLSSKDSIRRKEVINHLKNLTLHYDRIIVASSLHESANIGKTLAEISKMTSLAPEEVVLNLLLANDFYVTIFSEVINKNHILKIAKEEYFAVASDGVGYDESIFLSSKDLPHPRSFGTFPKALNWFVKENNILDWQTAIYKMTGLPAGVLGIKGRGFIEKGKKADIILFDPNKIRDFSIYENPFQFSRGIENVIINGVLVIRDNQLTGKFGGRILRKK